MEHGEEDTATVVDARVVKVTAKAMEERLRHAVSLWKAKLAKLTGKMNQIHQLMEDGDDNSLTVIQTNIMVSTGCLESSVKLIPYHTIEFC